MRSFKPSKRAGGISILAVSVIAAGLYVFLVRPSETRQEPVVSNNEATVQNVQQDKKRIRIIASGDMLPHGAVNQQAKTAGGYDYKPQFDLVQKYFAASDIRVCNQESPSAPALPVTAYPTFNAPPAFARDLAEVGCNVIGLANNHLNDKGQAGIDGTRELWDEIKPLAVAGANRSAEEQGRVAYFDVQGVKFAFVAYSEISNNNNLTPYGLNMLRDELVRSQLTEARSQADFVMVGVHWGTEYRPAENAAQQRWARTFAELGADFVFGSGPHVLQPVAKLPKQGGGETVVFYSLGNLLNAQLDIESLVGGLAVIDIDPDTKQLQKIGFLPTYMHYEWTPEQKAREDLLARKNLKLYPLDMAAEPLARSQNNTTVEAQLARITAILNSQTPVEMITSSQF